MKIFVTGGNGFIGSHLVKKLLARGDTVVCLLRDPSKSAGLQKLGAQLAKGDVSERATIAEPMRGADAVFHLAGMYKFGPKFIPQMRAVNVDGARNVLETAVELGVPKIVHTSTVGVFGNTRGLVVDETYKCKKEELASEYEVTKWEAHYDVATPLQKKGAPIMITQPGGVTGAGDVAPHMQIMDFYLNRFPLGFGAKSGITMAHVDDIADGHILAMERGKPGEAYIIAGPPITYQQMQAEWKALTGIPVPKIWLPGWMVGLNQQLLGLTERAGIQMPLNAEALSALNDYTFWGAADKAKRELGWKLRPQQETFREVLEFEMLKRGIQPRSN